MSSNKEPVIPHLYVDGITDIDVAQKLLYTDRSARKRDIECTLSFNKVKTLMKAKKCYFTGTIMNHIIDDPNQMTFDRIDNNKGYVDDNVVAACSHFNSLKTNLTVKDIEMMYKALKRHGDLK